MTTQFRISYRKHTLLNIHMEIEDFINSLLKLYRFLCKLKEPELLEPLMPAIIACLEHRHSYVRRNAVLAIFTIYRNFEFLIPDAPELIAKYLEGEQDMSCRRNAFLMLLHADQSRALAYLAACLDLVPTFGDILQLVIVELIYKVNGQVYIEIKFTPMKNKTYT